MWILVVEDDVPMGELLRRGLEESNHSVALATDGLQGFHAAQTSEFDAVILDVMMPGDERRRLGSPSSRNRI